MNVPIPLDADGYLRRECPTCEQQFKWHHGPLGDEATEVAEPSEYFCPFCGTPANLDQWWTKEQIEYAQGRAIPEILEQLSNETGLTIEATSDVPTQITEPHDMELVQSPCHASEPIKVPEGHDQPLHCLVCGDLFAV